MKRCRGEGGEHQITNGGGEVTQQWRRGDTMTTKSGVGSSSAQALKKAGGDSSLRGNGAGVAGGGAHLFIGARGHQGGSYWSGNSGCYGL
jgi:hypothetical protein